MMFHHYITFSYIPYTQLEVSSKNQNKQLSRGEQIGKSQMFAPAELHSKG